MLAGLASFPVSLLTPVISHTYTHAHTHTPFLSITVAYTQDVLITLLNILKEKERKDRPLTPTLSIPIPTFQSLMLPFPSSLSHPCIQDVITLLKNLKVQERQDSVCTTVAIAIVSCSYKVANSHSLSHF